MVKGGKEAFQEVFDQAKLMYDYRHRKASLLPNLRQAYGVLFHAEAEVWYAQKLQSLPEDTREALLSRHTEEQQFPVRAGTRGGNFGSSSGVEGMNKALLEKRQVRRQHPGNLLFHIAADMAERYKRNGDEARRSQPPASALVQRVHDHLVVHRIINDEDGTFTLDVLNEPVQEVQGEPEDGGYEFVVGMEAMHVRLQDPASCTCGSYRHWGIPCLHLAAACARRGVSLGPLIHTSELYDSYISSYDVAFEMPTEADLLELAHLRDEKLRLPPNRPPPPGRPPTARVNPQNRRVQGEAQVRAAQAGTATAAGAAGAQTPAQRALGEPQRRTRTVKCGICGANGHNRRTCPVALHGQGHG
mmetsp:Transcript_32563/g.94308  ORF Transcript_32563/g.94308 Transcript_32563/m.94308 type:complete len:359 (-) Transcript_32563:32-1108(-)